MTKKKRRVKTYPNWTRIQALPDSGFCIYVHEQKDPRRPNVYEAKDAEELLEFLSGVYQEGR